MSAAERTISIPAILIHWTPAIASGFLVNLGISMLAMALTTLLGTLLGVGALARHSWLRHACAGYTHFFQNAPWLVILFYCMLLLPFRLHLGVLALPLPDWLKAVFGITLGALANMAEIVRAALRSVPSGQWESSDAMAFTRTQTLWLIALPQCVRRMLPAWVNLYALVVISTPLCAVVGVHEGMSAVADMLAFHDRPGLLLPAYAYLLTIFFVCCYPIARGAQRLERALHSGDSLVDR